MGLSLVASLGCQVQGLNQSPSVYDMLSSLVCARPSLVSCVCVSYLYPHLLLPPPHTCYGRFVSCVEYTCVSLGACTFRHTCTHTHTPVSSLQRTRHNCKRAVWLASSGLLGSPWVRQALRHAQGVICLEGVPGPVPPLTRPVKEAGPASLCLGVFL